jgi:hypothetical protein
MKTAISIAVTSLLVGPTCWSATEHSDPTLTQPSTVTAAAASPASGPSETARRADDRYEEMLTKMQAAVEEIAQLYGNPLFLQVFTNDIARATDLKQRLQSERNRDDVKREVGNLEKKRDELLNDIALKEREAALLTSRLVRQRAALDGLAVAVEQARRAVEETAK